MSRFIYFLVVSVACGQYGDDILSLGGSQLFANIYNISIVFFVLLSAIVDFSSPDGEVTGQRSWTSRREEPVFPGEREARRCRYASYTN